MSNKRQSIEIGEERYEVEWILEESFDSPEWTQRWSVESQCSKVFANDGGLHVRIGSQDRKKEGVTVWYNEDLPKDVIVMIDASTESGEHACNLNLFLCAREADGGPLQYSRTGIYKSYHEIPNYLFTFTGGIAEGWVRARRNPGFHLVHENKGVRAEPGRNYQIVVICDGNRLSYYIDGTIYHDYRDEHQLPPGRFGLRTWFSNVNYDRVRIGKIIEESKKRTKGDDR